ncbi:hypothetical protein LR48_Vigan08g100400 [Vigna angularis]|uniref:Uncharacterized protein n=1 Tax=Phaseolus angularis TaxID=3914 RepID=A0A0L9V5F5_PHAAN|nr:hypothetical protein LR48_Vigan08g100400 [Vigna angularis]
MLCYLAPPLASFPFGKPTELELYQTATLKHFQHIHKHLTCIQNSTEFIQSAATSLSFGASSACPGKSGPKPKIPPLSGKLPLNDTSAKSNLPSAALSPLNGANVCS